VWWSLEALLEPNRGRNLSTVEAVEAPTCKSIWNQLEPNSKKQRHSAKEFALYQYTTRVEKHLQPSNVNLSDAAQYGMTSLPELADAKEIYCSPTVTCARRVQKRSKRSALAS